MPSFNADVYNFQICILKVLVYNTQSHIHWPLHRNKNCYIINKSCLLGKKYAVCLDHREFIFIVGYNFGTSVSLPFSLSLYLFLFFSLPPSLTHQLPNLSLSLSYPSHRLNSLKWKERKGGKEGEREMRRV